MKNKGLIAIIVVFFLGLLGVGAYYIFKGTTATDTSTTKATETKTGLSSMLGNLNLSGLASLL